MVPVTSAYKRRITYRIQAFPSQQRFFELRTRYRGFSGPIGSGKSHAICYMGLIMAARNPGCVGLIGAPTYPMLRDVTIRAMMERLEEHRIPHVYRLSSNSLFLPAPNPKSFFERSIITTVSAVRTSHGSASTN